MNKYAKAWLAELRNPSHPQGYGYLLRKGRSCALGDAMILFGDQPVFTEGDMAEYPNRNNPENPIYNSLSVEVQTLLGLHDHMGDSVEGSDLPPIWRLNDTCRMTKAAIADFIEEHESDYFNL